MQTRLPSSSDDPREEVGTLGRYTIYDRIGIGGMATVHLGRIGGLAGFSRIVAIKKLHDIVACNAKFVAMLLDEARLAALVRHPNVLPILEIVEGWNTIALVMEYVEGVSLDVLVETLAAREERVPAPMAVAIVVQMLHGLHAAHGAVDAAGNKLEIVHRDVSPENVLVGVDGVARVLDFGVARAAMRLQESDVGEMKGKLAYMSPEQAQSTSVDRRSDLFSAGVVLWELLTGVPPFSSESAVATISNVMRKVLQPPSRAGFRASLPAKVLRGLDDVVMRALERDPGSRYQTAEEMALALEDIMPLPKQRDVGKWVSEVGKETLSKRAAIARRIEADTADETRPPSKSSPELARVLAEVDGRRRRSSGNMVAVAVVEPPSGKYLKAARLASSPDLVPEKVANTETWLTVAASSPLSVQAEPSGDAPHHAAVSHSPPVAPARPEEKRSPTRLVTGVLAFWVFAGLGFVAALLSFLRSM
jgi:eukaryotic-like serine/threonine-protein kinase